MIVLVTGGCGFIGGNFINYIMRRHPDWQVRVLDSLRYAGSLDRIEEALRKSGRFTFLYGDILDRPLVEKALDGVDVVVHYAAESHVAYSFAHGDLFAEVNVRGTSILCETIVKLPVQRFIHVSSCEVYGTCLGETIDEEHPLNPRSPYAGSKAAADRLAYSYHASFGIPLVIVRPFNTYGPYQHTEKMIPRFIQAAIRDEAVELHDNGLQTRDWVYILDHVQAVERVIEADGAAVIGEVVNIGTGVETSVKTIAEMVFARFNRPDRVLLNGSQRPGQVRRQVSSTRKSAERLGWRAQTPLAEGLEKTVQWYIENRRWWEGLVSPAVVTEKGAERPGARDGR